MNQTHRTPSNPAFAADAETDLRDLDALVLAEIESLTARGSPTRSKQVSRANAPPPIERPAAHAPKAKVKASVAPIRTTLERRPESFGEEAELLFAEPDPLVEDAAEGESAGLLGPEEEAFITRAVGFLSQRHEADIILNRIWEQLTELDPEGYYRAPLDTPDKNGREKPRESLGSESSTATPPAHSPEG
jgi:hypothetical protein